MNLAIRLRVSDGISKFSFLKTANSQGKARRSIFGAIVSATGEGCNFGFPCLNIIVCHDDNILSAPSVTALQSSLNVLKMYVIILT